MVRPRSVHAVNAASDNNTGNEVVREQLVNAGAVDDQQVVHGSDGLRIGAGDLVMTRQNNPDLRVANRMTWTVTGITREGSVELQHPNRREHTEVPADYVRHHLHLAYATTVHGAQGQTVAHADTTLGDGTDAAALYVGMTRGRHGNTVHITATSIDAGREQWVTAAGRNRADLGLDHARTTAATEAQNYLVPDDDRGRWLREAAQRIRRGGEISGPRPRQPDFEPGQEQHIHPPGSQSHVHRGPRL